MQYSLSLLVLMMVVDIHSQHYCVVKDIKAIFIILFLAYFLLCDFVEYLKTRYSVAQSYKVTKKSEILKTIGLHPTEMISLNKDINPTTLLKLRYILDNLVEKELVGQGFNDEYWLTRKGRKVLMKYR
jgi:ABC-type phosphate/phosphonate transport system substrate-binding protein